MPDHISEAFTEAVPYVLSILIVSVCALITVGNYQWKKRWKWDE